MCISNFQWWLLYNLHFIPGSSQLISNWRDIPVNSRKWMLFIKYGIINKEAGMSVKTSVYISPLTTGYLHQNWQIMFPKIRWRHCLSSGRKSLCRVTIRKVLKHAWYPLHIFPEIFVIYLVREGSGQCYKTF